MYVYVQDKSGNPMYPTQRFGWVRRSLRDKKAVVIDLKPFTIRLTYKTKSYAIPKITLGIDPGRTNIGLAAIESDGTVFYTAECETRNKEIPKLMRDRRSHRQASRRGERLVRKRLAKRLKTTMKSVMERILPGCEKPVKVKDIINTEARFNNRKRPDGWLTPTATQLLRTHINLVRKVMKILPISSVSLEVNQFTFMDIENGGKLKSGTDYQTGPMFGFKDDVEALTFQQSGHCLLCKKDIEHVHHIVPVSRGGSDTLANKAGLCTKCHEKVHKNKAFEEKLLMKKAGLNKKYGALSVLNQIFPKLIEELSILMDGKLYLTSGWKTKQFREDNKFDKEHFIDAICIAGNCIGTVSPDIPAECHRIKQFRRHNRAKIHHQTERTYWLDKTKVATNRRKRMDQKEDSLEDWYNEMVILYGKAKADKLRSQLVVKKSKRFYNDLHRLMPGTVYIYQNKRYVMAGQKDNGAYVYPINGGIDAKVSIKKILDSNKKGVTRNTGLVYV